jgi:hypothetical protein
MAGAEHKLSSGDFNSFPLFRSMVVQQWLEVVWDIIDF